MYPSPPRRPSNPITPIRRRVAIPSFPHRLASAELTLAFPAMYNPRPRRLTGPAPCALILGEAPPTYVRHFTPPFTLYTELKGHSISDLGIPLQSRPSLTDSASEPVSLVLRSRMGRNGSLPTNTHTHTHAQPLYQFKRRGTVDHPMSLQPSSNDPYMSHTLVTHPPPPGSYGHPISIDGNYSSSGYNSDYGDWSSTSSMSHSPTSSLHSQLDPFTTDCPPGYPPSQSPKSSSLTGAIIDRSGLETVHLQYPPYHSDEHRHQSEPGSEASGSFRYSWGSARSSLDEDVKYFH
jgi:hypothetical protein